MISISTISGSALLVLLCLAITMWDSPSSLPPPTSDSNDFSSSFYREREEKIKEMIKIEGKPLQKYLLNRSQTKLPVLFDIKVDQFDHNQELNNDRPGFDLCIVLDRSGSMSGDKIHYSKIAIENLIDQMIATDTISFVAYDHEAITIFKEKMIDQRDELKKMVKQISVRGSTNLADGLKMGIDLLKDTKYDHDSTRLKRIFLFSDGLINEGEAREEVIGEMAKVAFTQNGIIINTFGVGVDFDEKILKNISKNGEGIFFFIGNSQEIPKKITKALKMITSTIGVNCYIKFEGINGATVEAIHGETSSNNFIDEKILLRELKEGDWKRLLLHLIVDNNNDNNNNNNNDDNNNYEIEKEILKYKIEFDLIMRDEKGIFQKKPITMNGSVSVIFTNDHSLVNNPNNNDIETQSQIIIVQMADLEKEVIKSINEQKYDQAINLKKKIVQSLDEIREVDEISNVLFFSAVSNLATLTSGDYQTAKQEANYNLYMEEEIMMDLSSALFD